MRSRTLLVAVLVAVAAAPVATAETGEVTVRTDPTFVTLAPGGQATFDLLLEGEVTCGDGDPPAIRLVASQNQGRSANGTAWRFDRSSFLVNWTASGGDRYTVDGDVNGTIVGDAIPATRVWSNVTWSALPSGADTTDPTGNGSDCGWPEARDVMAIIVPGPDRDDGDGGLPIPASGAVATVAALVGVAAWSRRAGSRR